MLKFSNDADSRGVWRFSGTNCILANADPSKKKLLKFPPHLHKIILKYIFSKNIPNIIIHYVVLCCSHLTAL